MPDGRASGVVIESSLDKGRGPVATVLVQQGTLKKGDFLVCGIEYGRVRALFDETGKQVAERGSVDSGAGARPFRRARTRATISSSSRTSAWPRTSRSSASQASRDAPGQGRPATAWKTSWRRWAQGEGQQTLNLVVKADVQGSAQALRDSLTASSNERSGST